MRTFFKVLLILVLIAGCWACGGPRPITSQTSQAAAQSGELRFKIPAGWVAEPTTSKMRFAQFKLPHGDQDSEDGSLVVYYFGQGEGGSVQANLDRWIGQMVQPDGGDSKSKAQTKTLTLNGLNVTTLDITGTYTAEMMPGAGDKQDKSGYRLRAAVVETPKGAYYAKEVGPSATIAKWDQAFSAFVNSFEFK